MSARIGVVAIGRNEGARLAHCLASLEGSGARVVYVDSGSTDDSLAVARAAGARSSSWTPTPPSPPRGPAMRGSRP
ncbi:glycosyl transferase, group 2 family protein [Limimaricola cinnabarinus]|uniref:Glycosyl transferase, group 2 family protein n=1 Tax=Limimaricola cinnabarinus LL-001 TaxID=1337093 RepID=U2YMG3_9RHOB|nr:glycosyl transferase, group 2 family protein [Limimaricola cinnabarinus LL-001]